jgi:hypothetical protein
LGSIIFESFVALAETFNISSCVRIVTAYFNTLLTDSIGLESFIANTFTLYVSASVFVIASGLDTDWATLISLVSFIATAGSSGLVSSSESSFIASDLHTLSGISIEIEALFTSTFAIGHSLSVTVGAVGGNTEVVGSGIHSELILASADSIRMSLSIGVFANLVQTGFLRSIGSKPFNTNTRGILNSDGMRISAHNSFANLGGGGFGILLIALTANTNSVLVSFGSGILASL